MTTNDSFSDFIPEKHKDNGHDMVPKAGYIKKTTLKNTGRTFHERKIFHDHLW